MSFPPRISRIALVCDYVPRQCGIATFSADVRSALVRRFPGVDIPVIAVTDRPGYAYPPEVSFEIAEGSVSSSGRIDVIPHGIPDVPFVPTEERKWQLDAAGRPVLLTFGLLNSVKGIEHVIAALPAIVAAEPDVLYIVLGATHPAVKRSEGEVYRRKLQRLVSRLGVGRNVRFCNRFVGIEELKEFLLAADIYVTPYLYREQITSGTLAYAFGCGKAVISTPYWHAEELLAGGRGVLVPFADSAAIARGAIGLLGDQARLEAMRRQAYELGRGMIWSEVARQFMATYQAAVAAHAKASLRKEPPAA
jgi:glycosyltransferase involved in cell wall biosynthesis